MKKYLHCTLLFLIGTLPAATATASSIQPFVDLLAWHASESNTAWAETLTFPGNTTHVTQSTANFGTRPGIKAGLSYIPDSNFWDSTFYWTYYSSDTTKIIPNGAQIVSSLFFSGSYFISGDLFVGGSANWQLAMNMFDLEASHAFHPTPILTLKPKVGIKGGSINQDVSATWDAIIYNSTENMSNHFTGIGPTFGLDGKLNVYQNTNLVGSVSTALMYGRWNVSDIYHRPSALSGLITPQNIATSMTQSKLGALMMDYFLGLEWIHEGRSRVAVNIGYEMQYWADQLRLVAIQQLPPLGDLTIEGATCGISIDL